VQLSVVSLHHQQIEVTIMDLHNHLGHSNTKTLLFIIDKSQYPTITNIMINCYKEMLSLHLKQNEN
jgi:hypothetical protein